MQPLQIATATAADIILLHYVVDKDHLMVKVEQLQFILRCIF